MGVPGLWSLVSPSSEIRTLRDLSIRAYLQDKSEMKGLRIGFDASLWLIRCREIGIDGRSSFSLPLLLSFLSSLLTIPILPLFVFDGPHRRDKKRGREIYRGPFIDQEKFKKVVEEGFGWETWVAKGEAEAEMVWLTKVGVLDGVWTCDGDAIIHSPSLLIRTPHCFINVPQHMSKWDLRSKTQALPKNFRSIFTKGYDLSDFPHEIYRPSVKTKTKSWDFTVSSAERRSSQQDSSNSQNFGTPSVTRKLSRENLVFLAALCGCDYSTGIFSAIGWSSSTTTTRGNAVGQSSSGKMDNDSKYSKYAASTELMILALEIACREFTRCDTCHGLGLVPTSDGCHLEEAKARSETDTFSMPNTFALVLVNSFLSSPPSTFLNTLIPHYFDSHLLPLCHAISSRSRGRLPPPVNTTSESSLATSLARARDSSDQANTINLVLQEIPLVLGEYLKSPVTQRDWTISRPPKWTGDLNVRKVLSFWDEAINTELYSTRKVLATGVGLNGRVLNSMEMVRKRDREILISRLEVGLVMRKMRTDCLRAQEVPWGNNLVRGNNHQKEETCHISLIRWQKTSDGRTKRRSCHYDSENSAKKARVRVDLEETFLGGNDTVPSSMMKGLKIPMDVYLNAEVVEDWVRITQNFGLVEKDP